jgi:N-ethylmaleimide reductase
MTEINFVNPLVHPEFGKLNSRVVMAPMTRSFATQGHLCTSEMVAYYERRAHAGVGLILTEGIFIHPSGDGYNTVPHLNTNTQMESWKAATTAVHKHGTKIFAQLWHCGRISHPDYTDGHDVVSSTGNAAAGINRQNNKAFGVPRPLKSSEFLEIYDMFCNSANLAMQAEFDGVELHMGHGYLVDQFLDARINDRTDDYGGSIENRCRFAIELLEAVIKVIGASKIMVRISPSRMMGGLYEWPDMYEILDHLIINFKNLGLTKLDISCANADYFTTSGKVIRYVRPQWPHTIIGGASLSIKDAQKEVDAGLLDMISWGRSIIANPDFVSRIRLNEPLAAFDDSMRTSLV